MVNQINKIMKIKEKVNELPIVTNFVYETLGSLMLLILGQSSHVALCLWGQL